jgi:hypothetical protein
MPNLVAHFAISRHPTKYSVQQLLLELHKPITAATLFGIIAFTPSSSSSEDAEFARMLDGRPIPPSDPLQVFDEIYFVRQLYALKVHSGAFLLVDSAASPITAKWTTPVRPKGLRFSFNADGSSTETDFDTIFEVLRLVGRQCDSDGTPASEEATMEFYAENIDMEEYHLALGMIREAYGAFAKRVSSGERCPCL